MRLALSLFTLCALMACANTSAPKPMSEEQRAAVSDTVKGVAERVFTAANRIDFAGAWQEFSDDADARFAENGVVFPSLDSIRSAYQGFLPQMDSLTNQAEAWNIVVLSPDAAVVTVPMRIRVKMKERAAYESTVAWSAVIARRSGGWKIVQAHESWPDPAALMSAMMPPPAATP